MEFFLNRPEASCRVIRPIDMYSLDNELKQPLVRRSMLETSIKVLQSKPYQKRSLNLGRFTLIINDIGKTDEILKIFEYAKENYFKS